MPVPPPLHLDDTPERDPQAQVVFSDSDEVVIVNGAEAWIVNGVPRAIVERLLPLVDGRRRVRDICAALGAGNKPGPVLRVLELLQGRALRRTEVPSNAAILGRSRQPESRLGTKVAILGNADLGAAICDELAEQRDAECTPIVPRAFASCLDPTFVLTAAARVFNVDGVGRHHTTGLPARARAIDLMTKEELQRIFMTHDLVVCALEGMQYRAILDVNEAALATGRPCIMVTVEGLDVLLGPTVIRRYGPCFGCSQLSTVLLNHPDRQRAAALLPLLSTCRLSDRSLRNVAARAVREEVERIAANRQSVLASVVLRMSPGGEVRTTPVGVVGDCPFCGDVEFDVNAKVFERRSAVSLSLVADRRAELEVRGVPAQTDTPYHSVGILGGGTAGYLTALALRTRRPELSVTLIESSKIPIIGVGEATTPRLLDFLHARARLDIVDFYRRVLPTWKLGIKFFWGLPGDYTFSGAFQFASLLEPMVYNGSIDAYSLGACLMSQDKVPVFDNGDGSFSSYLHRVPFAYHLDNARFVRYLQEEATRLGVRRLDRVIADAEVSSNGEDIACLIDDKGERHRFDLYIDASGFRSFLLEQKLGSRFISFGSSLFTDSAVVANVPHDGVVKPYTTAESMENGWCWNIPFEDSDHKGYVFSSAFCSLDRATDEMRRKNPMMSEPWSLKFRSGRHEHFWKGNVLAVGNAYAFVEPLESTGLELLTIELDLVIQHFPASRRDEGVKRALTDRLNRMWDNIRGLLAIHYRFNNKFDTAFWRECRSNTDLASAEARVALFADRAPLSHSSSLFRADDPVSDFFSQDYIYDVLLCGMQAPAQYLTPFESRQSLHRRQHHYMECARWAIRQADALRLLREQPEALLSVFENEDSWIRLRRY